MLLTQRHRPLSAYYRFNKVLLASCYTALTDTHTRHVDDTAYTTVLAQTRKGREGRSQLTDFMAAAMSSYLSACSASRAFCTSCSRSTILAAVRCAAVLCVSGAGSRTVWVFEDRLRGTGSSRCSCCLLSVCLPTGHPSPSDHSPSVVSPPRKACLGGVTSRGWWQYSPLPPAVVCFLVIRIAGDIWRAGMWLWTVASHVPHAGCKASVPTRQMPTTPRAPPADHLGVTWSWVHVLKRCSVKIQPPD